MLQYTTMAKSVFVRWVNERARFLLLEQFIANRAISARARSKSCPSATLAQMKSALLILCVHTARTSDSNNLV